MLRAMSAAGLAMVLVAAWAAGLPAAESDKSEAAAKAAEAFESLYGKEFKQARMTADVRDDIDLAQRLIAAAREAKDQPEFVAVLCEKACELASVPAGYATAAEALQFLAATVPEKSAACAAKLIEIRQKQYDAAKGDDRAKAGEALLDALLAAADAKEKEGASVEPAALLKRAVFVATAVKSDRRTEIETHLKAMERAAKTLRDIEDLKKQLEADPQKVAAREKLVRLLLVDCDEPAEAAKWIEGTEDAALQEVRAGRRQAAGRSAGVRVP